MINSVFMFMVVLKLKNNMSMRLALPSDLHNLSMNLFGQHSFRKMVNPTRVLNLKFLFHFNPAWSVAYVVSMVVNKYIIKFAGK